MPGFTEHPNVATLIQEDHPEEHIPLEELPKDNIEKRILHILGIYPKLSPSMLQVAMGTSLPPVIWKPILEHMILDGRVAKHEHSTVTPSGRYQTYKILSLPNLEEPHVTTVPNL